MRMETKHGFKRALAFALTLVMLLGMAPYAAASAYADYTVTVTVTGVNSAAVSGASVGLGNVSQITNNNGVATFNVAEDVTAPFTLTVTADNYETYSDSATPVDNKINVALKPSNAGFGDAFTVKEKLPYNGKEQELLTVDTSKLPTGATVTYTLNDTSTAGIPKAKDCKEYSVGVTVKAEGYNDYNTTYSVEIVQGTPAEVSQGDGLSQTADGGWTGKYNINKPDLVKVKTLTGAKVEYTLDGALVTECPKVKDVGECEVGVTVTPTDTTNYRTIKQTYKITITPSDTKIIHYNTTGEGEEKKEISSAECSLADGATGVDFSAKFDDGMYYNGKLKDETFNIHYNMDATADRGILIGEDGKVTWNQKNITTPAGVYTFTAEVYENDKPTNKYIDEAKKLKYTLVLYNEGSLEFEKSSIDYTLYGEGLTIQEAKKVEGDNGEVTYSIAPAQGGVEGGITYDSANKTLKLNEDKLLAIVKAAETDGGCKFTITAKKTAGTDGAGHTLYGEATASYTLVVKPAEIAGADAAKAAYTVSTTKAEGSDWYNSDVTVTAKDGYSLADTKTDTTTYGNEVTLTGSGETQDIYINNKTAREAYSKYTITDIKIDQVEPSDFHIEYHGATWFKKMEEVVSLGIAKTGLTVKLSATDALSGVKEFKWWFASDSVVTAGLKYKVGDELKAVPVAETDAIQAINQNVSQKTFTYEFELIGESALLADLKQYKGAIEATVSDRAGNVKSGYDQVTVYTTDSNAEGDEDTKVIIDQIKPVFALTGVTVAEGTKVSKPYYGGDVTVTFTLTEANIESEDIKLTVTNNGDVIDTPAITWSPAEPEAGADEGTTYTGSFTLSDDGEYTFSIYAADKATNKMVGDGVENGTYKYTEELIIDKTSATAALTYAAADKENQGKTVDNKDYIKGNVEYTVEITDNFFKRDSVTVAGTHIKPDGTTENFTKSFDEKDFDGQDGSYTASFTLDKGLENIEGEYNLTVKYTDYLGRDLQTENITLPKNHPVIDVTAPKFSVEYDPVRTDEDEGYFKDKKRTATIKVTEVNFDETVNADTVKEKMIAATDVTGINIKDSVEDKITVNAWEVDETDKTKRTMTVTFAGEANYNFDILAKEENADKEKVAVFRDLAGNEAVVAEGYKTYEEDKTFTIDWTAPNARGGDAGTALFSYNIEEANQGKADSKGSWIESIIDGIRFGFWKTNIKVTVTVEDNISGVESGTFVYTRAKTETKNNKTVYVSDKNAESLEGAFELTQVMDGDKKTSTFTGTILLPKSEVDEATEQLNGTLEIKLTDRCGNEAIGKEDVDKDGIISRIVYDTISPTAKVALSGVVNTEGDTKFFNSQIGVGISLVESNFFEDTVKATVNDNQVGIKWKSTDADNHQGTFSLTADGDYLVKITGMDYAGNGMNAYESGKLVLDTKIEAPEIQINGAPCDGCAYKDDAVLTISFFDTNYSGVNIKILRTRLGEKDVDVTEKFLVGKLDTDAEGGMAYIDTFTKTQDNDGIYTVIATVSDKATNSASATATFTLNRFGSVYEYGSYLRELIKNGGEYVKGITQDLTLTEYNADRLIDGSMKVEITRDGKLISDPIFTVKQIKANETDKTVKNDRGEKGWYEYVYTISKDNFKEDGLYKIVVSSKDATGNRPENSNYKGMEIQFYVDSVPPELTGVTGLEKAILNAERVDVKYTAYDTVGLKSIKVYVNGELYEEITNFSADPNNYNGVITILESTRAQSVRIVIEDLAGNITDTDAEGFTSAYKMVKSILVSTSFFARFYGNKQLFWGTVGGVLFLAAFTGIFIPFMKKRKEKKEEEETAAHLR